ncbi:hypothetical protein HPT29_008905 [Microvirga terrae]|uniref:DUF2970 domain-containing protein n=1 Tax=Microvirga terrae TaxID=2740529 RepID=A0ABY5RW01_9HYPH|nr:MULTISPECIES: hypothetical protein [Microvirga]MBQ0821590.1 hypothetical protein [Microvirga sp. HBU67558]UVF21223.1 hypothetical protein HPT29_008905 [Microvirga terrae]
MKMMHSCREKREPVSRPFPMSVALLFIVAGINVAATILSLLASAQG